PYIGVRVIQPRASPIDLVTVTALFLCLSGTKTFLQFSLLTLVLGLAAIAWSDRRPGSSALFLGLATIKPQIAIPFVLWMLVTRRWKILGGALLVAIGATLLFCLRSHSSPLDVVRRYPEILGAFYTGTDSMVGASQIGPLLARMLPAFLASVSTWTAAILLIGLIAVVGVKAETRTTLMLVALGLGAVWSLLFFRHLTYGFVLLLPTSALLLLASDPPTARFRTVAFS